MVFVLCPGSSKNETGDLNFFKLYLKTLNYYHPQIQKRKVGSNIYFKKNIGLWIYHVNEITSINPFPSLYYFISLQAVNHATYRMKTKDMKKRKEKEKRFSGYIYKLNMLDDILLVSIDINQFTTTNLRQNLIYYTSRLIVLKQLHVFLPHFFNVLFQNNK